MNKIFGIHELIFTFGAEKECDAVAEHYADCFGELATESESSSHQGDNVEESTGVSGRGEKGKVSKPGNHSIASR